MGLSKEQQSSYVRRIRVSSGAPVASMSNETVSALVCRTARDITENGRLQGVPKDLAALADYATELPELYQTASSSAFQLHTLESPIVLFERLVNCGVPDLDTYFYSLTELHKRRLRYENILSKQAFPRIEQVGPRAMLQYGQASPEAIAALLTWRKWIYDIDNRAAQETGYVFEPALIGALGGASFSASSSPVRRIGDPSKGRQVDCLVENAEGRWAYEFKIRVTIAASGQGRWGEELLFPREAKAAGFTPVLVVFDATVNEKLTQLSKAYRDNDGLVFTGDDAWQHLEDQSGAVMGLFVEKYLRAPLVALLEEEPEPTMLPSIEFSMLEREISISIAGQPPMIITRSQEALIAEDEALF